MTIIKRIVIGIDQSTGASSAFGLAIYDPNTHTILATHELRPKSKRPDWQRIKEISDQLHALLDGAYKAHGPLEVRCEGVVMRGRSGQIIAWAVGTIIAHLPPNCTFSEVHNIKLKSFIAGSHNASKREMGQALLNYFISKGNKKSIAAAQHLVDNEYWDAVDATCIAIYEEGKT